MKKKITLIGDIMCEPLLLKAARRADGSYQFDSVFQHMKAMFAEADFVIGNLETPLAGKDAGYTNELFSFNTPDAFADAVKAAGISFVSTANNHCMDRGYEGLQRTLTVLDQKGIPHGGTFRTPAERSGAFYFTLEDQRFAVLPYTYGANFSMHGRQMTPEQEETVSFLHAYTQPIFVRQQKKKPGLPKRALNFLLRPLKREHQAWVKKKLGMVYNTPRADDYIDEAGAEPYLARMERDLKQAAEQADIVIFYPHTGGQFNLEPGKFTELVIGRALAAGCDAIIASHPHIVQKAESRNGVPCFYSVGNFSMSPNSVYLLHEHLPEYGLAVHLYAENGSVTETSFSVLKIVETKKQALTVYPVDEYDALLQDHAEKEKLLADVRQICRTVTGCAEDEVSIRREYPLSLGGRTI